LNEQKGIKTLFLSGTTAVFTLADGVALDEGKIAIALEEQQLKFVSASKSTRARPKDAYELAVDGLG
jgi:hypothetical protein